MKICLVMGTRPNFMKIAALLGPIKNSSIESIVVHTGQHYDDNMSKSILSDLSFNKINYHIKLSSNGSINQFANIMTEFENICTIEKPDIVVVPGDVNSSLACALVASKLDIRIAHLEAGLRSFDRAMPEEINRLLTDQLSDYLFITEESAKINLINEGIDKDKIVFTGNTMIDTLSKNIFKAKSLKVCEKYGLLKNQYCLVTMHRPSNVDDLKGLKNIIKMLNDISSKIKVIFPIHPRTKKKIQTQSLSFNESVICIEPLPYLEFLSLMSDALIVLTDSGGVQEETTYLDVQCVTFRENTERPVTIEIGTNHLVGVDTVKTIETITKIIDGYKKSGALPKYWDGKAGQRTIQYLEKVNIK
jgi:UDP-N-acetylglucosamine 2-epimerase (non-hydrolysing)